MNDNAWAKFAEQLVEEDKDRDLKINKDPNDPRNLVTDDEAECVLVELLHIDEDSDPNPQITCQIKFWGSHEDCQYVRAKAFELDYPAADALEIVEASSFVDKAEKVHVN